MTGSIIVQTDWTSPVGDYILIPPVWPGIWVFTLIIINKDDVVLVVAGFVNKVAVKAFTEIA